MSQCKVSVCMCADVHMSCVSVGVEHMHTWWFATQDYAAVYIESRPSTIG